MTALTTTSNRAWSARRSSFRRSVSFHAIDTQAHMRQPGVIQPLDQLLGEEQAVRGHHATAESELAHAGKQSEEIWVEGRFASHQGDGPGPKVTKPLEPRVQGLERDRGRRLVVFGAVAAGQIASSRDDQLCQEWPIPEPIQP